jgi:hypothetical protein
VPMVADPGGAPGPRTGLILDGAGGQPRVALELLGEHDRVATVKPDIGLDEDDPRLAVPGVSGDPLRGSEYCRATNLRPENGEIPNGRFVIELGEDGLPFEDSDGDGRADANDNCNNEYNPLQSDQDENSRGDVCDADLDGDGRANVLDNCVFTDNFDQEDADGDGEGEACDITISDADGDGWYYPWATLPHLEDNCPRVPNSRQWDFDSDGDGDACDWEGSFFQFLTQFEFPFTLKRGASTGFTGSEVDEMMYAMMQTSPLKEKQLHAMLTEVFEQWKDTKTTFIEFVVWAAEKEQYMGKKYE